MNDSTTITPSPAAVSLRPFFALWTGQALSLVGSRAVQFAIIWWLTAETGSAAVLAMAAFVGLLAAAPVAEIVGAHAWFYVGGLTCVSVGIAGFFMPTLLRLESGAD